MCSRMFRSTHRDSPGRPQRRRRRAHPRRAAVRRPICSTPEGLVSTNVADDEVRRRRQSAERPRRASLHADARTRPFWVCRPSNAFTPGPNNLLLAASGANFRHPPHGPASAGRHVRVSPARAGGRPGSGEPVSTPSRHSHGSEVRWRRFPDLSGVAHRDGRSIASAVLRGFRLRPSRLCGRIVSSA